MSWGEGTAYVLSALFLSDKAHHYLSLLLFLSNCFSATFPISTFCSPDRRWFSLCPRPPAHIQANSWLDGYHVLVIPQIFPLVNPIVTTLAQMTISCHGAALKTSSLVSSHATFATPFPIHLLFTASVIFWKHRYEHLPPPHKPPLSCTYS